MKVAIIGAGICGLYLAKNLALNNKVAVFEAKPTIGKQCCSGLFSSRLFDFIPEARHLAKNQISRCVIHFPKREIGLRFRRPFFIIEHSELDLLVAALATQAGAQIRVNTKIDVTDFARLAEQFDRVIGCDGALSPTRKFLKLPDPEFYLGIQGFEQKRDSSDIVETWATKNGFLWRIPRTDSVEWGIMEKPCVARQLFDAAFLQGSDPCKFAGVRPLQRINLANIKSAIIPSGLALPKNKKMTICGDASGLTKPWSGGGVIWNLTQADILLKNFPNFLEYRNEATSFFSLRIFAGRLAKQFVYFLGFNFPYVFPKKIKMDGDYLIRG